MKRCTSNRDDCKLENTVKQSWFKHLGELHKEWTEAGVSASRVTTLRRLQEKGYQPTSEPETTSEASYLGCGEKELDCCSVVCWPWYYCAWLASQHAWPEPHIESMGYFQEKDEKQSIQQSRWAEGSIVPQQCHRLIASMPYLTDAGVCAKGARPSIECINEHTFKHNFT